MVKKSFLYSLRPVFICIALVAVILGCLSLFGCIPNINDMYAKKFADQLIQTPAPDDCLVLEHHMALGKLVGNGNNMDFAAVVLLQTGFEITIEDVIEHYSAFDFVPAKGKNRFGQRTVMLDVEQVEQAYFDNEIFVRRELRFENIINSEEYRYYAVIIYDGGYEAGFDLQGN